MEIEVQQQAEPATFVVGDMAVHPAHGVGEVTAIDVKSGEKVTKGQALASVEARRDFD